MGDGTPHHTTPHHTTPHHTIHYTTPHHTPHQTTPHHTTPPSICRFLGLCLRRRYVPRSCGSNKPQNLDYSPHLGTNGGMSWGHVSVFFSDLRSIRSPRRIYAHDTRMHASQSSILLLRDLRSNLRGLSTRIDSQRLRIQNVTTRCMCFGTHL